MLSCLFFLSNNYIKQNKQSSIKTGIFCNLIEEKKTENVAGSTFKRNTCGRTLNENKPIGFI